MLLAVAGFGALACVKPLPPQDPAALAPETLFLECDEHLRQGRAEQAEQCCRELLGAQPEDGLAWLLCGLADRRAGRLDEALAKLHKALRLDASEAAWEGFLALRNARRAERRAAALRLEQAGAFAEAAALLEQESAPTPELDCELGGLYLRAGDLSQAESRFLRAASGPLPRACALRGLGFVSLARGRTEQALSLSRRLEALGEPPLPLPRAEARPDPLDDLRKAPSLTRAELALLLVRLGPSAARSDLPPESAPLDLEGHPLQAAVAEALARGWMRPVQGRFFEPERLVDRLELGATVAALISGPASAPAAAAPEWRKAFPELAPLWDRPPFQDLAGPRELLRPATGAEAVELLRGLGPGRATRADARDASGTE